MVQKVINRIKLMVVTLFPPIFAALLFTGLIVLFTGNNPFLVFASIFKGATASSVKISDILVAFIPLILATCGVVITFTAGLWNIGIEGQIAMGAVAAVWVLRSLESTAISPGLTMVLACIAGCLGGAIWASLAAGLKHFSGVSEIFAGLGLNYIASAFCLYVIFGPWKRPGVASMSGTIPFNRDIWLPTIAGLRISPIALLVAFIVIALLYLIMTKTRFGLELKAVGLNSKAAMHLGISNRRTIFLAFIACGTIAGLTGAYLVLGVFHRLVPSISSGYGFLALLVGMLVNYDVLAAIPVAIFFAILNIGSIQLPLDFRVDSSLAGVIQSGLVLFFLLSRGMMKTRKSSSRGNP